MNRFILLDRLRHSRLALTLFSGLYLLFLALAQLYVDNQQSIASFFWLSLILGISIGHISPSSFDIESESHIDHLLPVPRNELVNTWWCLLVLLPASWLTVLFFFGSLFGLTQTLAANMPAFLSLHVFAAYACGAGVNFLGGNLIELPTKSKWPLLTMFAALWIPIAYLVLLWSLQDFPFAPSILLAISILIVVSTYRAAHSRRLAYHSRHEPPEPIEHSSETKTGFGPSPGWLRQSIADYFNMYIFLVVLGAIFVFLISLILFDFSGSEHSSEQSKFTARNVVGFLVLILAVNQFSNLPSRDEARVLRTLPISAGHLACRVLIPPLFGAIVAAALLTLTTLPFFDKQVSLRIFHACVILFSLVSCYTVLVYCFQKYKGFVFLSLAPIAIFFPYYPFDQIFDPSEASNSPLGPVTHALAITSLIFGWWLLKRFLTNDSALYRAKSTG